MSDKDYDLRRYLFDYFLPQLNRILPEPLMSERQWRDLKSREYFEKQFPYDSEEYWQFVLQGVREGNAFMLAGAILTGDSYKRPTNWP